jgi:hypothetical protein
VLDADIPVLLQGILVTVIGGGILALATIGVRYWNGSHDLKARRVSEDRQKAAGMLRWFYGTPADPITGTPATPGAIETFPAMQSDVRDIKVMVTDLVASNHRSTS